MNQTMNAEERLESVASEFNYERRCRACRGKLWHESYEPHLAAYTSFGRHKLQRIAALARGGRALLDVGCGLGDVLHLLRDRYEELHGIDPSSDMVATAVENLRDRGVSAVVRQGLAEALPYADATFDTVVTTDTYEHIDPAFRAAALREMSRVLVDGWQLILVTPSRRQIALWALVDNLLTLPSQIRRGGVRLLATTPKQYTEIFCSRRELLREVRAGGFEVSRFERTSFYPAPERPGFAGSAAKWMHGRWRPGWTAMVRVQGAMQRLGVLNQKMLVEATASPDRSRARPTSMIEAA